MTSDGLLRRVSGERFEVTLWSVFIVIFGILGTVDALTNILPNEILIAAIFAALWVILRLATKLYTIELSTQELLRRGTSVQRYRTYDELYGA
jgi:UDP-N-acetylmuramyl pentapeptide phosphotransferase/UDP-N-acetylglucosamine-1-phosphate transferase